jgi:ferrous iron transport protein B
MIIAMAGQPNSGKSTIFNHVAGYKTITSNFPGKTVEYTESKVTISGEVHTLIDLPGTYSLTSLDPAELEARNYLLRRHADVTINVVDASLLARSIELTIQLSELEVPYILVLNMMDEARKKGVTIDKDRLSRELGVPVVEAVANKGVGITQALEAAIGHAKNLSEQHIVRYSKHVEDAIIALMPHIEGHAKAHGLPPRLFALKLLEADPHFEELVPDSIMEDVVLPAREVLEEDHGHPSDVVISSERHAQALNIFERVAHVATAVKTLSERLDGFLMHPVYGYAALIVILYAFFNIIFRAGNALEPPIMDFFSNEVEPAILSYIPEGFASTAVTGIIQGIAGGIGIVLPYLFPFLVGLSVLEDLGYLPRIAFVPPQDRPPWKVDHPVHTGIRVQRARHHGGAHPRVPARQVHRHYPDVHDSLCSTHNRHTGARGRLPGWQLGALRLPFQHSGHCACRLHPLAPDAGGHTGHDARDPLLPPPLAKGGIEQDLVQDEGVYRCRVAHHHRGLPLPLGARVP